MMKLMRKGYPTIELAIAGGIEQMEQVKVVGDAQSAVDANLRFEAAGKAMIRRNAKHLALMRELRGNIKVEPLTPEKLASRVYPGRKY